MVVLAVAALTSWFILFWRKNKKAKLLPYKAEGETFLSTAERQTVRLVARENITHDVRRFRFALPKSKPVLGLPLGKCIKVYAPNIAKGSKHGTRFQKVNVARLALRIMAQDKGI